MSVHTPRNSSPGTRLLPVLLFATVCLLAVALPASAAEYHLSAATMDQFGHGINYTGTEPLVISIDDDVAIAGSGDAAIASAAPLTIRSPSDRTLTLSVNNQSDELYGIVAPSVAIESGKMEIDVTGANANGSITYGIYSAADNVTLSGGQVTISIDSPCHKNKGIYATRYVVISDGNISISQHGGANTFGIDSSAGAAEDAAGGVIITGGTIAVSSGKGGERNVGIDSKYGTVTIAANPVISILADAGTGRQNYVYNPNITKISGGHAVVFTSSGGSFVLREDAVLTRNASLVAGRTTEIPVGKTLTVGGNAVLRKPAGTTFLFGNGYGTLGYDKAIQLQDGAVLYTGKAEDSPLPILLAAGVIAAALLLVLFVMMRKKE
jgi:hypothetical protein